MIAKEQYSRMVKQASPNSRWIRNMFLAFCIGGTICTVGQGFLWLYDTFFSIPKDTAAILTSASLIAIAALLTGFGKFDDLAKYAGAGTLVPITGFANAMTAPALDFKTEGFVLGVAAKMFIIAGPVIVYGTLASIIYGFLYWMVKIF